VIFCEQAVDVHAAGADGELAADEADEEGVGRGRRVGGAAEYVERSGLNAARELGEPIVPVGVELDASLFHDDAGVVLEGIEGKTACVEAHCTASCLMSCVAVRAVPFCFGLFLFAQFW
jgi:hypothetical protein